MESLTDKAMDGKTPNNGFSRRVKEGIGNDNRTCRRVTPF